MVSQFQIDLYMNPLKFKAPRRAKNLVQQIYIYIMVSAYCMFLYLTALRIEFMRLQPTQPALQAQSCAGALATPLCTGVTLPREKDGWVCRKFRFLLLLFLYYFCGAQGGEEGRCPQAGPHSGGEAGSPWARLCCRSAGTPPGPPRPPCLGARRPLPAARRRRPRARDAGSSPGPAVSQRPAVTWQQCSWGKPDHPSGVIDYKKW